ncbi:MAG: hypothetical protein N2747_10150 [Chitinophagaceae bacterium]|nr:hypothetical protein [Chitinophagaceae bacterium]
MTVILIILGIAVIVLIIWALNNQVQKQDKGELNSLLEKIHKEIFPNGKQDIDEGTKELLRILNYSIDEKTAQNIFVKSSSICYITSMNGSFSKERLKQHLAPYALKYFDDYTINQFYNYLLSKNKRANELNKWFEITRQFSETSNPKGTDKDEMPEGYGEFGLEITNPIPTSSIPDSYFYLDSLRTKNGEEVTYKRIGSMKAPNIKHPIDAYRIFANGKQIATIYICPYNKKNSTKAPNGFKIV